MPKRIIPVCVAFLSVIAMSVPDLAFARGGGGGGGHGGGGGGHGGGGGFGGGHFAGGGWGGRGFGGGYRGYGWGGNRGFGWGGYRGYGWGYPYYGFGLGLGLGAGLGYGLSGGYGYGGYGGYGYGGYGYGGYGGYGYPGYGYGYGSSAYAPVTGYGTYYPSSTSASPSTDGTTAAATQVDGVSADGGPATTAEVFAARGEAAFEKGDYQDAVYALRHAVVDAPQNALLTMLLGQALLATGRFDEAAGATQAAMRLLPKEDWGIVVTHYKEIYGNSQDYTKQLRALEKAVKEKPADAALRFLAGFHYAYLGFSKQAIDQLEKGLKLAPRDDMARQLRDETRARFAKPSSPPEPQGPAISN